MNIGRQDLLLPLFLFSPECFLLNSFSCILYSVTLSLVIVPVIVLALVVALVLAPSLVFDF